MVDTLKSERVKIVLDPSSLFAVEPAPTQRAIVAEALDLVAEYLVMSYARDRTSSGRFVAAGRGVIDFTHYISALNAVGFKGPLLAHGLRAEEASEVAAFLKDVCRKSEAEPAL